MLHGKLLYGILLKLHCNGIIISLSFRSLFSESHDLFYSEIKERIKKTKDEKKAKKAEVTSKQQKTQSKGNLAKSAATKGPKLGGGGKR